MKYMIEFCSSMINSFFKKDKKATLVKTASEAVHRQLHEGAGRIVFQFFLKNGKQKLKKNPQKNLTQKKTEKKHQLRRMAGFYGFYGKGL